MSAAAVLALGGAGASSAAAAAPILEIRSSANSTVAPGGELNYFVDITNVGGQVTSGDLTLDMTVPVGLELLSFESGEIFEPWECSTGARHFSCELASPLGPGAVRRSQIRIQARAEAGAPEGSTLTASYALAGGGASPVTSVDPTRVSSVPPLYGIDGFDQQVFGPTGSAYTQAAGHPTDVSTEIGFNTVSASNPFYGQNNPVAPPRDALVDLPPGFVGDPATTARCTAAQLVAGDAGQTLCPAASQIGTADVTSNLGFAPVLPDPASLFNMVAPTGIAARFGFKIAGTVVVLDAQVRSGGDYGLTVASRQISEGLALTSTEVTFWGVPADPVHDAERSCPGIEMVGGGGPSTSEQEACAQDQERILHTTLPPYERPSLQAFLRDPTSCTAPGEGLTTTVATDSWFEPGAVNADGSPNLSDPAWKTASTTSHEGPSYPHLPSDWGPPVGITGCNEVPFEPTITVAPTTNQADSPTGVNVDLKVPQGALTEPEAIAQSDLKGAVVKFPPGMTINPAQANGLGGCTESEIDLHGENTVPTCPNSSKIGKVTLTTPLLEHPIEGSVYLAAQGENPFHSLLALYIVGDDKAQSGTVIKLAGKVNLSQQTGQLETVFVNQPQLPFEELALELFGGATAPLITPAHCGTYATESSLTPWSGNAAVQSQSSFAITSGPSGSPCPPAPAPFSPRLEAGATTPTAGAYSPFTLRLTRGDGEQRLGSLAVTLPEGLLGKLAGIPYCPDSTLGSVPTQEGTAAAQLADPSCPAASQVGVVTVGAGAGPNPFFLQTGKAYLAGPYKGAPLSLAIVTPALAGPFDLGNVLVRSALQVDPETTRITAVSDPLPQILDGIPLDLRDVRVNMNRPAFTINPTDCDPTSVGGTVSGSEGATAQVSSRFQVGGCNALGFKPTLKLSLKGSTHRAGHPAVKAVLTYPQKGSYANIAKAQVGLPHSEFLDQGNLNKVCTRPELASQSCPAKSIYGHAKAWSPLVEKPLEGPVYLAVGFGYKLPALVAELDGQIRVLLKGKVDTDKAHGIRNTFEAVPDAPVSRFELTLKGGPKYGLLENSEDVCRKAQKATAAFTAQNGKELTLKPVIGNGCGKSKKGKKRGKKSKGHHDAGRGAASKH